MWPVKNGQIEYFIFFLKLYKRLIIIISKTNFINLGGGRKIEDTKSPFEGFESACK